MNKLFLSLSAAMILWSCSEPATHEISLAGEWQVMLDSLDQGVAKRWFEQQSTPGVVMQLPGTIDENGLGVKHSLEPQMNDTVLFNLTRRQYYTGKVWYHRTFDLPADWNDEELLLTLERVLWRSSVWINGKSLGSAESLSTPHRYSVKGLLKPGENSISILVDNSFIHRGISFEHERYPTPEAQGFSHAYSNHTQGKWNGILGEISLQRKGTLLKDVRLYTEVSSRTLRIEVPMKATDETILSYTIRKDRDELQSGEKPLTFSNEKGSLTIQLPEHFEFWEELNPAIYTLDLRVNGSDARTSMEFGLREIRDQEGVLQVNGQRVFLRGNLDCAVFPVKGRTDMTKAEWLKTLKVVRSYGFNHIRFHSWCPPKGAFEAADQLGMYLQVELPHWSLDVGADQATNEFLENEAFSILREYGNHPSFVLMTMGNELEGDYELLNKLVAKVRASDTRRLYTTTTFSFQKGIGQTPQPEDDYFITQWTDKGWIRGQGFFNTVSPRFDQDFEARLSHIDKPIISHEIGQYAIYPDFSEIEKYTGVWQALNFEAIRLDLERNGLLPLAPKFTQASGQLAALLYKEDIERALKTPSMDGFQMLQLQDYPGHGTALVGLLNVFWESKGIMDSTTFRQFNAPVVPLLRFEKAAYRSGELFEAKVQVANFTKPIEDFQLNWEIRDKSELVANGRVVGDSIPVGNEIVGEFSTELKAEKAKKLTVRVELEGTAYRNQWDIWVYPKVTQPKSDVVYTQSFMEAKKLLAAGKSVLLNPNLKEKIGEPNRFGPIFWSQLMFEQPSNMGLLVDPEHRAFTDFPTEYHSNWQWWDLCTNSRIVQLGDLEVKPLIRVIDNFTTNRNQGLAFEANVGAGKLLFTTIDLYSLLDERVEARQLRYSLMRYMDSEAFQPDQSIDFQQLSSLKKN
ncbi:sugar-binding domain-containing protein [Marinoscillum furvescens]|nr:sugar-binding domain-containing protein [Marinoscillum furvescens]